MGNSYEERHTNDTGKYLLSMATAMGIIGSWAPSLAGPPPPFDGPQPALEKEAREVIRGAALAGLTVARTAVNRHWADATAAASEVMQASVKDLTSSLMPSWKEHLDPLASWQVLIDSCGDTLGNTDGETIMFRFDQAEKARSGNSQALVPALSPPFCFKIEACQHK